MKTALTQLIEKWEAERGNYIPNAPIYAAFIAEAKEFLEAEKEQIIDASVQANLRYDTGADEPVLLRYCNDAEQYYQITFKSD